MVTIRDDILSDIERHTNSYVLQWMAWNEKKVFEIKEKDRQTDENKKKKVNKAEMKKYGE